MVAHNIAALFELIVKHAAPFTCITVGNASTAFASAAYSALLATIARPRTRRNLFLLDLHQLFDLQYYDNEQAVQQTSLEAQRKKLVEYLLNEIETFWETTMSEVMTALYINFPCRFPAEHQALRVQRFIVRLCARYGQQHITSFGFFACRLTHEPIVKTNQKLHWVCWCLFPTHSQGSVCYHPLIHHQNDRGPERFPTVCLAENMYKCIARLLSEVVSLYVTAETCLENERQENWKDLDVCDECRLFLLSSSEFTTEINRQKKNITIDGDDDGVEQQGQNERNGLLDKLRHIEFVYVSRGYYQAMFRRKQSILREIAVGQFLRMALNIETKSPQVRLVYCPQVSFCHDADNFQEQLQQLHEQQEQSEQQHRNQIDHPVGEFPHHVDVAKSYGLGELTSVFPNACIVYRLRWFPFVGSMTTSCFEQQRPAEQNDNNSSANANEQQQQQQQQQQQLPLKPKFALAVIDNVLGSLVKQALTIVRDEQQAVHRIVANMVDDDDGGVAKRLPRQNHLHFQLYPEISDTDDNNQQQQQQHPFYPSLNSTLEALLLLKSFRALVALVVRAGSKGSKVSLPIAADCQWRHLRQLFDICSSGREEGGKTKGRGAIELQYCQKVYQEQAQNWWLEQGQTICGFCPKTVRPKLYENFGLYKGSWTNISNDDDENGNEDDNWLKNLGLASNTDFRPLITMFDWTRRVLDCEQKFPLPSAKNLADAYCNEIVVARRCKSKLLSYAYKMR